MLKNIERMTETIWGNFRNLLYLGSTSNTYRPRNSWSFDDAKVVQHCFSVDPKKTMDEIVRASKDSPKIDSAIFAYAVLTGTGKVYERMNEVIRTGFHLFMLVEIRKQLGLGWGSGFKRAIDRWYTSRGLSGAAYQMLKYRSRRVGEGVPPWTHRDVLRLAHLRPMNEDWDKLFQWSVGKGFVEGDHSEFMEQIYAYEELKSDCSDIERAIHLIEKHRMTREMLPTQLLKNPDVQWSMLQHMPLGAMLRNLRNLTESGLLVRGSEAERLVENKLRDAQAVSRAMLHPVNIYVASKVYGTVQGRSTRIEAALEDAFEARALNLEPTGKRILIAIDDSGSMWGGYEVSRRFYMPMAELAAAMSITFAKSEPNVDLALYSSRLRKFDFNRNESMRNFVSWYCENSVPRLTDCSLPFKESGYDVIIQITDSGHNTGESPQRAFSRTRGVKAVNVCVSGLNPLLPDSNRALNINGFDSNVPKVINEFISR